MGDEIKKVKAVKVKKVTAKVAEPEYETGVRITKRPKPVEVPPETPPETALAKAAAASKKEPEKTPFWKKWWFWLIVLGLALAVFALFREGGAGSSTATTAPSTAAPGVSTTAPASTTKSGWNPFSGGKVDITLPAEFFEGQTKEQIEADAASTGFEKCVVNDDGSVTYTMTKSQQQELLNQYKGVIDDTINQYKSGSGPKSYRNIVYNEGATQFDVRVDAATYQSDMSEPFYIAGLYMLGAYYQVFNGIPADQADVVVNVYDDATNQLIESGSYKQYLMKQQNGQA